MLASNHGGAHLRVSGGTPVLDLEQPTGGGASPRERRNLTVQKRDLLRIRRISA